MVLEPDVLLLDEPLGALDLKLREHMKIELKMLQNQFDTTFLYITHDQSEALVMSDHVAVMNAGRFEQIGTPQELYYSPQSGFVAGFVGDSNRWPGRVDSVAGSVAKVAAEEGGSILAAVGDAGVRDGARVEVFVRPEAIALEGGGEENTQPGTVDSLLFNGANSRVLVRTEGGNLVEVGALVLDEAVKIKPGDMVTLGWPSSRATCFSVAG
jgi:spermidine/putrescine transport system ATP-binding protein